MRYILLWCMLTGIVLATEPVKKAEQALQAEATVMGSKRVGVISSLIKNTLENYHYKKMKINDDVSQKAYDEFIKKIDYGKQFLLKKDVNFLDAYKTQMDDEIQSGKLELLEKAFFVFQKRLELVEKFRQEIFKTPFDFDKKEYLELDPEKRDFCKTEEELKDHWRRVFKQSTLVRLLTLQEEQENAEKNDKEDKKKKKAKKKEKKLSLPELKKKATEAIAEKYQKVFARLKKEDREDYLEKYYNSIATIFDPHTIYLPPKRKEDFDIDMSGSLEGIGAVLQEDGGYIKVVKIMPGGPAWRQKELAVDDVILMAKEESGTPVDLVEMRVDDAVRYIRGKKGTKVYLTIKKVDGTRKTIELLRDVIQISESFAKSSVLEMKSLGIKIGYIHVPKFYRDFTDSHKRNCTDDVRAELKYLEQFQVGGLILDLRNNGGGSLEDAKQMAGLFLKTGPIVQVRQGTGETEVLEDSDPSIIYGGPIIVLTNRLSASASEIVAGALKDYKRAVVVGGENSHGKGTVQAIINLNQNPLLRLFGPTMGALKITIQKFYRVTGASTQYKGVVPDIIIPDPFSYAKNREQDLDYSMPWDEVKPLSYVKWDKHNYDLSDLQKASKKRVAKNARFQKINKSVEYLTARRDQTRVPLNLEELKNEEAENKKISEELKMEDENKEIMISEYEASLMRTEHVKQKDKKSWLEDVKTRKEDWQKLLRQDPVIEEAMYIMNDIIRDNEKK